MARFAALRASHRLRVNRIDTTRASASTAQEMSRVRWRVSNSNDMYAVMALLRDASRLARLIATLGLFSVFQSFMVLRWGIDFSQPRSLMPSQNVTLFGNLIIGRDRLELIGVALACAFVLHLVYSG